MKDTGVVSEYNRLPIKDRENYELEIRYAENSLSTATVIDLIKIGIEKYNAKEILFIDSLSYGDNFKVGTRTMVENNTTTKSEYYKKTIVNRQHKQNMVGKYSLNLSKEMSIDPEDIPTNLSTILLKRRFSFVIPKLKWWRFDISIVRKTEPSTMCLKMAFKEFFTDITTLDSLLEKIAKRSHIFSVYLEIEYITTENVTEGTVDEASMIGFLVANPDVENNIRFQQEVLHISDIINGTTMYPLKKKVSNELYIKYVLPQVKTLTKQSYFEIYPPTKYLLKEKVDGHRAIISIRNNVASIITEPKTITVTDTPKYSRETVVECEVVENTYQIYDVLVMDSQNLVSQGIESRISYIQKAQELLSRLIPNNEFVPANYYTLTNSVRYKNQIEEKFNNSKLPVDGLIFAKTQLSYKDGLMYKWKPLNFQSMDLLCKRCPTHLVKRGNYPEKEGYVLYFLYTTASRNLVQNLRLVPNYGYNDIFKISLEDRNIPIPFSTPFVPLSYIYYHPNDGDDIDGMICEFNCDRECVRHDTVHNRFLVNWCFIKKRNDRGVIPGVSYGNNYATALYVFLNHINLFDISHLYNGIPEDQYYQNVGGEINVYTAIRALSNYVKAQLINEHAHKSNSVLDIGSGRGGDLFKYVQQNLVKSLVVLDIDKTSLSELFARWLEMAKSSNTVLRTSLRGIIMDINQPYEGNIRLIKSLTETTYFDAVFCHSSLHYFCESIESMRNFTQFCQKCVTSGGKVVITCPVGESIFNLLKNTDSWSAIENNSIKYQINKEYTDIVMTEAGQKISVILPFSKGKAYSEYLVNTNALVRVFKESGFSLLLKKTYSNYLEGFNIYRQSKYKQLTENDREWSKLYQGLIFRKN